MYMYMYGSVGMGQQKMVALTSLQRVAIAYCVVYVWVMEVLYRLG